MCCLIGLEAIYCEGHVFIQRGEYIEFFILNRHYPTVGMASVILTPIERLKKKGMAHYWIITSIIIQQYKHN